MHRSRIESRRARETRRLSFSSRSIARVRARSRTVLAMRARRRAMAISASRAGMITMSDYANAVCALRGVVAVVVVACALDSEAMDHGSPRHVVDSWGYNWSMSPPAQRTKERKTRKVASKSAAMSATTTTHRAIAPGRINARCDVTRVCVASHRIVRVRGIGAWVHVGIACAWACVCWRNCRAFVGARDGFETTDDDGAIAQGSNWMTWIRFLARRRMRRSSRDRRRRC